MVNVLTVKRFLSSISFFIALGMVSLNQVWAEPADEPMEIIFYEDNEPFSYINNGQADGLWVKIVQAILEDMNTPFKVHVYPFKRALYSATVGEGAVVGIVKNDQRLNILNYSNAFYRERNLLWVHHDHTFQFQHVSDLSGLTVGVKVGWSYGDEFDQAKEQNVFSAVEGDVDKLYKLLSAERIDALVDNDIAAPKNIASLELNNPPISLSEPLLIADIYLAVQKGTNADFLERFNRSLAKLEKQGRLREIQDKFRKRYLSSP